MSAILKTFAALSDETRMSIVDQLLEEGELPAGRLIEGRGMSGAAISRHLKVLRNAGLVDQRVQGTQRIYSVRPAGLRLIGEWAISKKAFWEASLDRLETALTQEESQ